MFKIRLLLAFAVLLAQIPLPVTAQTLEAVVVSVGDGDTVRVKQNGKNLTVRLACIDAPEMGQRPWGQQAKNRLQQLLPPATKVKLRAVETDRFKRLVAEIYTQDNRSINTNLVQEGNAAVYRQYLKGCSPQLQTSLLNAESSARGRRLGIWSQNNPVMPWEFRRSGKRTTAAKPQPQLQQQQNCDPSYPDFCIPPNSPDLDCKDMPRRQFRVLPPDPHGLDRDSDGIGCE
ncbi:nuclease [Calothrix sp. HK-06]|nr:nuclease [Calothrix sp. HK-06]